MKLFSRLPNDRRPRRASQRRRQIDLERLEHRVVLSNVTTSFATATSTLTITGDVLNDNFNIIETSNGSVTVNSGVTRTVPGLGVVAGSTINNTSSYNTGNPVSAIVVNLPGKTNFDFVNLYQNFNGKSTVGNVTITAANPSLGADFNGIVTYGLLVGTAPAGTPGPIYGVQDSGNLTVTAIASPGTPTNPTIATGANGVLQASVTGSTFAAINISQYGAGTNASHVALTNDTAAGNVGVSLGEASGDTITLMNNTFGPTALVEGNVPANGPASHDVVNVSGGTYRSLYVNQMSQATSGGVGDQISINNIKVAAVAATTPVAAGVTNYSVPAGVTTIQGNGAGDVTFINGVTTFTPSPAPPPNLPLPAGVGYASIDVRQGNGSVGLASPPPAAVNDQATVENSNVPGYISIWQQDLASNTPSYNSAVILNDVATGKALTNSVPTTVLPALPVGGNALQIVQGDAGGVVNKGVPTPGDQASITGSTSGGIAYIKQGAGTNDFATISNNTSLGGATIVQGDLASNPWWDTAHIDNNPVITGNASITQGNASGDIATINNDKVGGNDTITQGNGNGDSATVSVGTAGGNVTIKQGDGNGDTALISLTSIGGNASITQGNGNGDVAVIDSPTSTMGTIGGSITISQGNGNGDQAEIEDITSLGGTDKAPIVISINQGNGNNDVAAIVNLFVNGGANDSAGVVPVSITQGTGSDDWAEIANLSNDTGAAGIPGNGGPANANITIKQQDQTNNSSGDTALVLHVNVQTVPFGGADTGAGNVTITQGNAAGDIALVQGNTFTGPDSTDVPGGANNITITQGSNGPNPQVSNGSNTFGLLDIAEINDMNVTSDITINQGVGTNSAGNYVAAIAYDYLGATGAGASGLLYVPGVSSLFTPLQSPTQVLNPYGGALSSSVTAGGVTAIDQTGSGNQVFLGDSSAFGDPDSYFFSTFLDVYTGAGGGAYVQVLNTFTYGVAPLGGPFSSTVNIEGGTTKGANTIVIDAYSAGSVTWDTYTFNATIV